MSTAQTKLWESLLGGSIADAMTETRKQAFLDAIRIAENEKLRDETGTPEDIAYNLAIEHVIQALRRETENGLR